MGDILPEETLLHVFSYCNEKELCAISRVCYYYHTNTGTTVTHFITTYPSVILEIDNKFNQFTPFRLSTVGAH